MNIPSTAFILFGLAVCIAYNLSPRLGWRQMVLLIANITFLSTFSKAPSAWLPFVLFLVLGYISYLIVYNRRRGAAVPLVLGVILSFFWLKKYTFLPAASFLTYPYVTLGLSYVLFRLLHLLVDTRQGVITERIGILSYTNYLLNFTAIVSGPIQLYEDYAASQLRVQREPLNLVIAGEAVQRIIWGFFKAAITGVVFDTVRNKYLGNLAATATQPLGTRTMSAAIIAAAYPLYLYCNFSGYTDIVIGVARGFRLTMPENFNRPFSSTNFIEFWSRWHISLSSWLKTYVYSPLLKILMERVPGKTASAYLGVFSYFVTFFLVGVWHGRTSVFLVFGVLQGLGVSLNKLYQLKMTRALGKQGYRSLSGKSWYVAVCRGLTFTFFAFSLVWFWSSWAQMGFILHALGAPAVALCWVVIFTAATSCLSGYEALRAFALTVQWGKIQIFTSRYTAMICDTAMVVVMATVLNVLSVPTPEIVYKAF